MKVTDKKEIVKNYFDKLAFRKKKKLLDKMNDSIRLNDLAEKEQNLKRIKTAMLEQEKTKEAIRSARAKDTDKRQVFLKLSSSLNIIS